jgi:hypothetical protein
VSETQKGPHWDPTDYYEATARRLEIQTDKQAWKIIPCTHGGCDTDLLVNTFYSPAKGKCATHGSSKPSAIATSKLVHSDSPDTVTPNGSLAKLLCPICENPLTIYAIDDKMGWITFHCTSGSHFSTRDVSLRHDREDSAVACGTSITVRPNGAWIDMRHVANPFRALVEHFNAEQKVAYFDNREAQDATATTPKA